MKLDVSKLASDPPRLQRADIRVCVFRALQHVLSSLGTKGIQLIIEVESPRTAPWFDPHQIEDLLVQLLDNACKFTPANGHITIRGHSMTTEQVRDAGLIAPRGYRVEISHAGPGMAPDRVARLFDEQPALDGQHRRRSNPALARCRRIVHAHRGRIWADSGNRGLSFHFILPTPGWSDKSYASN